MKKIILPVLALAACFLAACNSKTTSTATSPAADSTAIKNKATALSAMQSFVNKDVDGMTKNAAPGFIDYGTNEGTPMKNMDSIKTGIKDYLAAFPDVKGTDLKAVASGDSAIVTATWSGTFKKDYMGMKANNKSFKYDDADIFTFDKDGKFTSHRSVQSMAIMSTQLGFPLPAAEKK